MALTQIWTKRLAGLVPRGSGLSLRFLVAAAASVCIVIWLSILASKWPFTEKSVTAEVQKQFGKAVQIGKFHATLSPLGYVAENIRFLADAKDRRMPEATIRKVVVVARPIDLLLMRKRVKLLFISGLRYSIPNHGATRKMGSPRFSEIDKIQIEDAVVQFPSFDSDADPLSIAARKVTFNNVSGTRPGSFAADFAISEPQGAVQLLGQMGPWNWQDVGRTPITGFFAIPHTDLGAFGGIAGLLDASGRFAGPLDRLLCSGSARVPDFSVSRSGHSVSLAITFRATINGLTGDTTLEKVQSHFNRTVIESQGAITKDAQRPGKAASLHFSVEEGQIGDLLLLFTHAAQPAMAGTVDLSLDVELPPGPPGFIDKLALSGDFGIDRGHFTKSKAQVPINHLSESAAGMAKDAREESRRTVLSDVAGHISAHHGIAKLSDISFAMPGAHGVLSGTYNLLNQGINLQGRLLTTGELSSASSGLKAVFLKMLTPLLKKHSVTIVPFTITGTAQHPAFALDLLNKHRS